LLSVHNGPDGEVFLPAVYFRTSASSDDALRMGRETAWLETGGPVRGVGQKTYLVGDEDRSILTIRSIEISGTAGSGI
jgi:type VI secretion system protein ImpE